MFQVLRRNSRPGVDHRHWRITIQYYGVGGHFSTPGRVTQCVGREVDEHFADAHRIVFESRLEELAYQIYVMDADGSDIFQITHTTARNVRPAWSPDGERIAFISGRDGEAQLYLMNADGSAQRRLTFGFGVIGSPSWSPDGGMILFNSDRTGDLELYAMRLNGQGTTQLTSDAASDFNGVWRP